MMNLVPRVRKDRRSLYHALPVMSLGLHYSRNGICRASTQYGPAIRLLLLVIISEPQRRKDCHILLALAQVSGIEILPRATFLLCSAPGTEYTTIHL
jgi:hypothetical protein